MLDLLPYLDFQNNPFNLLGLSVQTDAKEIRHRREDIEAALDTDTPLEGFEKSKFRSPDLEDVKATVLDAFGKLEDPKERFLHSVFWFWPLKRGTDDDYLKCAAGGSEDGLSWAIRGWERNKSFNAAELRAARHNLAIAYLLEARRAEDGIIASGSSADSYDTSYADFLWQEAIAAWYTSFDDETLWDGLARKIKALDDPRLSVDAVRYLRKAVSEIIPRMLFTYVERHFDVGSDFGKRHLALVKDWGNDGSIDVRGMFEDKSAEVFSETKHRISVWSKENLSIKGLDASRNVLEYAEPKGRLVLEMFGKEDSNWIQYGSLVADFVRAAIVAYGNASEDYRVCIDMLSRVLPFAVNPRLRQIVTEDKSVFEANCRLLEDQNSSFAALTHQAQKWSTKPCENHSIAGVETPMIPNNASTSGTCSETSASTKASNSVIVIRADKDHSGKTPDALKSMHALRKGEREPIVQPSWNPVSNVRKRLSVFLGSIAALVIVVASIGLYLHQDAKQRRAKAAAQRAKLIAEQNERNRLAAEREAERAMWASRRRATPPSGTVTMLVDTECDSGLQIKTKTGANYLVKLVSWRGKKPIETIFVRGGKTVEVAVPSGRYEIRFASGTTWYGDEYLFGPETRCAKADELFSFSKETGYTLALYEVSNGNLPTSGMSLEDF